ncbi:MAG: AbrB/MazE/SpoVT family DNA-binding domain-containing protein [Nitrososphaeraceae archaeon]
MIIAKSTIKTQVGEQTTLTKASSKVESLRTTVPRSVVTFMKLKEGDKLDWDLKAEDNKMILTVSKVTNTGNKK